MTFVKKQNAGLLKSARSWGVLGLVLALAFTVGYGQIPIGQPQPVLPPLSLPVGEMVGDILILQLSSKAESEVRTVELSLTANFSSRGEFTGSVSIFAFEPLDAQPDPVNRVISRDTILTRDTISSAKANLTLALASSSERLARPSIIGVLVLVEKSSATVSYSVSTPTVGVEFSTVVDDAKFATSREGGFGFTVPTVPDPLVVMTYKIFVESLFVQRNQRTGSGSNFEGLLELRGEFSANNVAGPIWPSPSAIVSAAQSQTVMINQQITTVTYSSPSSNVPILAKLWEIEFCCLGATDSGQNNDSILLNGSLLIYKDVVVNISFDNWKERGAILIVKFRAERQ